MNSQENPHYRLTDRAERDLEEVVDYTVQEWGASQANAYLGGLESRVQLLAENPDLGVARDAISQGLLSFPYESHILYYRKHASGIVIIRVLHQHMDPVRHL